MNPGADGKALAASGQIGRSHLTHALVVLDGPAEEDVVPAAEVERGDSDVGVRLLDADLLPVVVVLRVGEPVVVVRRQAVLEVGQIAHRQMLVQPVQVVLAGDQAVGVIIAQVQPAGQVGPVRRRKRAYGPRQVESQLERAALPGPALVIVGSSDARSDSSQRRSA